MSDLCSRGMPKYWAKSPKDRKPFTPYLRSWIPIYGMPFWYRSKWIQETRTFVKVKVYDPHPWIVDL